MSNLVFPQFDSADAAGIAAVQAVVKQSIKERFEFAGRVVGLGNGKFSFTAPTTDRDRKHSTPGSKVAGRVNVGTYHTHGGEFDETDEIFSPDDKLKATLAKEVSYLGTPRQRVLKYTPVDLLPADEQDANPTGLVEVLQHVYTLREINIVGDPAAGP